MTRTRISYTIPPPSPSTPIPKLQLPPLHSPRHGYSKPLLIPTDPPDYSNAGHKKVSNISTDESGRHRLGIQSLALDRTTSLQGRSGPEGLLYTGGRDGLVIAHDVGVAQSQRIHKYGFGPDEAAKSKGKWEVLTGWEEEEEEEEEEDDGLGAVTGGDGDVLGEHVPVNSVGVGRNRIRKWDGVIPYEEKWEVDLTVTKEKPASSLLSIQTHSDWINDLLLINYNQTIVSASSDGTIKAFSPLFNSSDTSEMEPSVIGYHSDYVRSLAKSPSQPWLASGSFDRTIKLWDPAISSGTPTSSNHGHGTSKTSSSTTAPPTPLLTLSPPSAATDPKTSIYSLTVSDAWGSMLVSGGPERVVRLWDPRIGSGSSGASGGVGKGIGTLVGHTDVVRSVIAGWGGDYLLTAGADASIKLWSLRSPSKCLHTFSHHTDSVWALWSAHPRLEVFYSGDKTGNLVRVDCTHIGDLSEGECVLLGREMGGDSTLCDGDVSEGLGINSIVGMDDTWIWTSSEKSSVSRWRNVGSKRLRRSRTTLVAPGQALRDTEADEKKDGVDYAYMVRLESIRNDAGFSKNRIHGLGIPHMSSMSSLGAKRGSSLITPIPHHSQHLQNHSRPHTPQQNNTLTLTNSRSSAKSSSPLATAFPMTALTVPPPNVATRLSQNHRHSNPLASDPHPVTLTPAQAYAFRDVVPDAIPYQLTPHAVIQGDRGLLRSIVLNDRVHAISVDTAGEVRVWNIVRGVCEGFFSVEDVLAASKADCSQNGSTSGSTSGSLNKRKRLSPRDALETVKERIEGEGVTNSWCAVDTKVGDLCVHLTEKCFEAECFADEVEGATDPSAEGEGGKGATASEDEVRVNLGRWVLTNLFRRFIEYEAHHRRTVRHHPQHIPIDDFAFSPRTALATPGITTALPTPTTPKVPLTLTTTAIPGKDGLPHLPTIPQSPTSAGPSPMAVATSPTVSTEASAASRSPTSVTPKAQSPVEGGEFSFTRPQPPRSPTSPGAQADDFVSYGPVNKDKDLGTPGGFMGRLKWRSAKTLRTRSGSTIIEKGADSGGEVKTPGLILSPQQQLLNTSITPPSAAEAPSLVLSPLTSLQISEEQISSTSSSWNILYRGFIGMTAHPNDVNILEHVIPYWAMECIIKNQIPVYSPPKISFSLAPWHVPGSQSELPELMSHSRLTASRFLRIRKVSSYIQEKINTKSGTSPRSSRPTSPNSSQVSLGSSKRSQPQLHPEQLYEILCNDAIVPWYMTLAAVRQYIWRQSAELVLYYRRRPSS